MRSPVRRTLTERRSEELRLSVALAAHELFVLHGGTDVTVESICLRAGISQRTFYRHFAVKEDVVVPLFERAALLISEALEAAPLAGDVVTTLTKVFTSDAFEGGDLTVLQRRFLAVITDAPEYWLRWHAMDEPLTGPVADYLARRGLVGGDPFDRALRAGILLQSVRLAYHHWIRTDASRDLDELMRRALATAVSSWEAVAQRA